MDIIDKKKCDLNEVYFRLNHIIIDFEYVFNSNNNVKEQHQSFINKFANKYVIFENIYRYNRWYQKLYCMDTKDIYINTNFNFIKLKKDMSFKVYGQCILDEYKNLLFIVNDVVFLNIESINDEFDILYRIKLFKDILETYFVKSDLDIFIFYTDTIHIFNKENIEYFLKNVLVSNDNKIPIQSIQILNRSGILLKNIECRHCIHLNQKDLIKFFDCNKSNIDFIINKHIFDLKSTKKKHNIFNFIKHDDKLKLWTIKNTNTNHFMNNLSDIYFVTLKECDFNENDIHNYENVNITNIYYSKLFRKLINDNKNGFWFSYIYHSGCKKFIPVNSE